MVKDPRMNGNHRGNGHGHGGDEFLTLIETSKIRSVSEMELDRASTSLREARPSDPLTDAELAIEAAVQQILESVGEDTNRDGLTRTPYRVAKMYRELLGGYVQDLTTVVNDALFDVEYGEGDMVVVANIDYDSLCEHHMLPFSGRIHVAYLPGDKVVGLSKIPRIVDMFARRLQIQERIGEQIATALEEVLDPQGVMVVVEGQHSCAALRGVKKHGVNMVTTAKRGEFRRNPALREEFYRLIGK